MFSFLSPRRNIPPNKKASYLKKCVYDPVTDPLCPIIKLGTIVKEAGEDYNKLAYKVTLTSNNNSWISLTLPGCQNQNFIADNPKIYFVKY